MKDWTDQQIKNYYLGIKYSDYPRVFWKEMKPFLKDCKSIMDIGCGPGAFALKALEKEFDVYGIDKNKKHLDSLEKASKKFGVKNLHIFHDSWLKINCKASDASICAHSLGEEIGTSQGIEKVLNFTKKVAFFITPFENVQTDFFSQALYKELKIKPRVYSKGYKDILEIFNQLKEKVQYSTIAYDFGMPFDKEIGIKGNAMYLAEKLGIPYDKSIEQHMKKILIEKKEMLWIPNIKKSILIVWNNKLYSEKNHS